MKSSKKNKKSTKNNLQWILILSRRAYSEFVDFKKITKQPAANLFMSWKVLTSHACFHFQFHSTLHNSILLNSTSSLRTFLHSTFVKKSQFNRESISKFLTFLIIPNMLGEVNLNRKLSWKRKILAHFNFSCLVLLTNSLDSSEHAIHSVELYWREHANLEEMWNLKSIESVLAHPSLWIWRWKWG